MKSFIKSIASATLFLFCCHLEAAPPQTIAIVTYKAEGVPLEQTWDPDSISSGLTGSEEAIVYMSEHLVKLGYKVTVFGHPPKNSSYSTAKANPRYLHVDEFNTQNSFDMAISWRMPVLAKELKKCAKKVYFWPHDRTWPTLLTDNQINDFDDVLWVSKWQREEWVAKNPGFAKFNNIYGNGVNPAQFQTVTKRKNPYSCIYGSNYGQGLFVLLDIWPTIKAEFPKATLDVYYGWNHFGFLTPEKEAHMRKQIEALKTQGVTDHGMVGHAELNKAYSKASFWTYPCVGTETFSITALRAQISGAIPVIIKGSGLLETVGMGYKCDSEKEYRDTLIKAMREAEDVSLQKRKDTRDFVLENHTWHHVAMRWKKLFDAQTQNQE